MNTSEITNILLRHYPEFGGVYPANHYHLIKNNSIAILNTDESNRGGRHWVAVIVNNQTCEFFDSLGVPPENYHSYWHKFLIKKSGKYVYNDSALQNLKSADCGKFCIFYTILRSQGIEFSSILRLVKNVDLDSFIYSLISESAI